MLLQNLHIIGHATVKELRIGDDRIQEIAFNLSPVKDEIRLEFNNAIAFPGLINSHDHLEMNLYPKLGAPPYANYVEWANDIYKPTQSPIKEIEKLPIEDRLLWGGVKNLISGVTTVVHHNPWHRFLGKEKFPVSVLKKIAWAHSLQLGKKIENE
jgi:cytosine/adenosine deaminase-related metal-dependent hydrolase